MGIKGIYSEIGTGRRVALAKLADETLRTTGEPLRIAVDAAIWLFQIQASDGGANPEIRTFYYRLVRLLLYGIKPVFVFDGPNKPPFKRNSPTSSCTPSASKKAKRLIDLFGFKYHDAPGEAEAECAKLQQLGVVHLVLSEDVDTLAFGCTRSIRSWTAENARGNKSPTHVTLYDSEEIKIGKSRLDREGMILIALMSGGDYLPEGIPRCGTKLACEAARAGFGHDLCEISVNDDKAFEAWRERLCHELSTNESGFFRTKHKAIASQVPEDFPDRSILGYHAHPVTSATKDLIRLKLAMESDGLIDIKGLRDFVDEEFNWKNLSGAKKFLRQIAPALLANKLRALANASEADSNMEKQVEHEERLVLSILSQRLHFSTDGTPELKLAYIPSIVADLDLDHELPDENENSREAFSDDDDDDELAAINSSYDNKIYPEETCEPGSPRKKSRLRQWNPWDPDKAWILQYNVECGIALTFAQWNARSKSLGNGNMNGLYASANGGMRKGAIESYLRVSKPTSSKSTGERLEDSDMKDTRFMFENSKPMARPMPSKSTNSDKTPRRTGQSKKKQLGKKPVASICNAENPWTLAQRAHPEKFGEKVGRHRTEDTQATHERFSTNVCTIDMT